MKQRAGKMKPALPMSFSRAFAVGFLALAPLTPLGALAAQAADPPAASAATPAVIPPGARLAATCTGCHGTNGVTAGDALPALAGQPKESLLASLKAFKAGERPATVMTQLAKGYSDQQLDEVATFFAEQNASGASR
jgi:sulfide dehydrogenase cytochrome subunit